MTGDPVVIPVQWALHGRDTEGEGYRVLSCSNGDLNRDNFEDALGRFSIGVVGTLPQVSVSYLQPVARHPDGGYLALAIDWFAPYYAGGADEHGRKTAFTSYFCAPYRALAEQAITYQDMYRAFSGITLPGTDGPLKSVPIGASSQRVTVFSKLTASVAALLLTGTPVCVLGAEETTLAERLWFIDSVMALLPYGFRARMTAATWTRSTYQGHRFRLYFSSAPRTGQDDHTVHWAAPDDVFLTGLAKEYFAWLEAKISPLTRLACLSEPRNDLRFDDTALPKALELAFSLAGRRRLSPPGQRPYAPGGDAPQQQAAPTTTDEVAKALEECVGYISDGNVTRVKSTVSWLAKQGRADSAVQEQAAADPARQAQAEEVDQRRSRYREQLRETGLLHPHETLGPRQRDLYGALLAVAFGRPLTYTGYCQVEDCLDNAFGEHPHPALLNAIKNGDMAFETRAIVYYLTRQDDDERELNKWYGSGELDPVALIYRLAETWLRPHHARVACGLVVDFLGKAPARYNAEEVRLALHRHGFLARMLSLRHPGQEQHQIFPLHRFIRAAYPNGLDKQTVAQILTGSDDPPTPALLAAVLLHLTADDDIRFAKEAYVHGSLKRLKIHPDTFGRIQDRLPRLDVIPPADPAAEPAPWPAGPDGVLRIRPAFRDRIGGRARISGQNPRPARGAAVRSASHSNAIWARTRITYRLGPAATGGGTSGFPSEAGGERPPAPPGRAGRRSAGWVRQAGGRGGRRSAGRVRGACGRSARPLAARRVRPA